MPSPSSPPVILITGASGMLGRALHRLLRSCSTDDGAAAYTVIGTAYSRLRVNHYHKYFPLPNNDSHNSSAADTPSSIVELHRLDLLDNDATAAFIQKHRPDIIVHCAAQRYPDAFESNLTESIQLNVNSTRHLAQLCVSQSDYKPHLIYISTSYVFDGGIESKDYPPYFPTSIANPINNYGKSKWEGECAIRDVMNAANNNHEGRGIIVRVPLLYGEDCIKLEESPALEMMKVLLPKAEGGSIEKKNIDDWALRFPTSCEDVAKVLKLFIDRIINDNHVSGTYHVSSPAGTTKYGLLQLQSELLNISKTCLDKRAARQAENPSSINPSAAPRPQCTQLSCEETWTALGCQFEFVALENGMARSLNGFPERFVSNH